MSAVETIAVGTTIAGKYKIQKLLGEGGMGAVYAAENIDIGRNVAIKVLHAKLGRDEGTISRFRQEARAAAAINHPGIVDVLDMGETEKGEPFIVMERLVGETLAARLRQRGKLSLDEVVSILIEVLDALEAAHAKGIIHRDLKPDNIFLVWRPKWEVKILDFGISRLVNPDELRLTATNTTMGSVLYMPPEQARDAKLAEPPADLYTIGAVMYHALTGRPPFLGERYSEVLSKVLTDPHEPIEKLVPDLPPGVAKLVDSMLSKDPHARPPSARMVRDTLLELVGPGSRPTPSPRASSLAETMPQTASPVGETVAADPPKPATANRTANRTANKPANKPALAATMADTGPARAAPPQPRSSRGMRLAILGVLFAAGIGGVAYVKLAGNSPTTAPADAAPDVRVSIDALTVPDAAEITAPPVDAAPRAAKPDARREVHVTAPIDAAVALPAPDAKRTGEFQTDFVLPDGGP